MKIGKLTNRELEELVLSRLPKLSSRTISGADIGADCASLSVGDQVLYTSSDPITAGGSLAGMLSIIVSCNDIASCGVRPIGILLVILAPPTCTREEIVSLVDQASAAAKQLHVDIVGGHTEITDSVNRFVVTTTAYGLSDQSTPVVLGKAQVGDTLLMTKYAALEGTLLAVTKKEEELCDVVSPDSIATAKTFSAYLSVMEDGVLAASCTENTIRGLQNHRMSSAVHLMHDVTEGGILGAAYEMAQFSGVGVEVVPHDILLHQASKEILMALSMNPYRTISSGSMLISTGKPDDVIRKLLDHSIPCCKIGQFIEKGYFEVAQDGSKTEMMPPEADEIYRL